MNAPTTIPARLVDSDAQSLIDQCRKRRWDLLQQFARLEIALKNKLQNSPKTFGAKVKAWMKIDPARTKGFERLIAARNLVAHAFVSNVRIDDTSHVLWEVAEGTCELQCAKFDKPALLAWADDLDELLKKAIAEATA